MGRIELLAPAGNMDCLKAAVMAGCDAVYLGGKSFGARSFSKNFSDEELIEAINYCHLYGVKVYVTVNTLIYDNEVDEFIRYVEFIHKNNVDAIIIQDLGMFDLVRKTFPELEIHISTQMHIHNIDGTKLMESLGAKRVVLARETNIDMIRKIKEETSIELEIFIHGAFCISYSGQCLMSSLIGGRSGNRGSCAGSCRLKYDVVTKDGKKINTDEYPLSTKDLNSLEYIGDLIEAGVSSLKIEGRMKSKEYVYMVVSIYREAIDSYYKYGKVLIDNEKLVKLKKIFNRDYTKGFLNGATNDEIINGYRPNHMGVKIGKIVDYDKGIAIIKLCDKVVIGSGLRVIGKNKDVGIVVNDFYKDGKLVKEANCFDIIRIKVNDSVEVNDLVVITTDKSISDEIDNEIKNNPRKIKIKGILTGKLGSFLSFKVSDGENLVEVTGNMVGEAINKPTSIDDITIKLEKLGDTIYEYDSLSVDIDDFVFIPLKELNELRRKAIVILNEKRLYKTNFFKGKYEIEIVDFPRERKLTSLVNKMDDVDRDYDMVYCYEKKDGSILKLPRVMDKYPDKLSNVLVGEIGAFYKGKNLDSDFSLNVVNSYTVAFLHSLGARKVTLSYEMNNDQIRMLIDNYHNRYGVHPNIEVITNGYEEVMISKFSLDRYYNRSGLYLRNMFGNLYRVIERDKLMYIYNYKKRDNYSDKLYDMGVNSLRINKD